MTTLPTLIRTVADLRNLVRGWQGAGHRVGLVPTMGALHDGHLSLVTRARADADHVIVSLFVNPTQFGPNEDLSRYPRDEASDLAKLASVGCDGLFAPAVAEIYPAGFATSVHVARVSEGLCGAIRPGHFDGVATVVSKLLIMAGADVAVFGEKDFQQLQVIRRLVADLNIPTEIIGAPIVRDADGLALSSRNAYLSVAERQIARALPRVLQQAAQQLRSGTDAAAVCQQATAALLAAGFHTVDYVELRSASDLQPLADLVQPARLLAAARVGTTRLLDNLAVAPTQQ
jgi:pantoate--beta-alanine ligase